MKIMIVAAGALLLGGCATITRGTTSDVQVKSTPEDADVRTSYGVTCRTPCTLKVARKDEFSVTISKSGYDPQTVDIKTKVAGTGAAGFAGNILVGGVVGMVTDAATGATLEHFPNPVDVTLYPTGKTPQPPIQAPEPDAVAKKDEGVPVM
ncbi:MAG: hypothetical protein K0R27_2130 [Xanthobacteraceae bacterium]|jgi:hypothetical protein|nr:hypothetical protein [Xanthobacteraceae bacterium]